MKKKIFSILVAIIILVSGCDNSNDVYTEQLNYKSLPINELKDQIKTDKLTTIYVYSLKCLYCKKFNPILINYLESKNKIIYIINKDIDEEEIIALTNGKFEMTPSIFTFRSSELVDYISGMPSEELLESYFNRNPL